MNKPKVAIRNASLLVICVIVLLVGVAIIAVELGGRRHETMMLEQLLMGNAGKNPTVVWWKERGPVTLKRKYWLSSVRKLNTSACLSPDRTAVEKSRQVARVILLRNVNDILDLLRKINL